MIANLIRSWTTPRYLSVLTLAVAALLSMVFLPALFGSENTLQIHATRQGIALPDGFYVYQRLNAEGVHIKSITPDKNALVIKFDSQEQREAAKKILRDLLPHDFYIAQLVEPGAFEWINRLSWHRQMIG